jgi:hypothetical protein
LHILGGGHAGKVLEIRNGTGHAHERYVFFALAPRRETTADHEQSATKAVGYDVTQMGTFRPKVDPATLEFVLYERVIRDPDWWKFLLEDTEHSVYVVKTRHLRYGFDGSDDSVMDG